MKAWLLPSLGSIDNLKIAEPPAPIAKENEAVVEVHYAALNPADRYLAEGAYPARPAFPHILGRDGMGVVHSVHPSVQSVKPGEKFLLLRGDAGVSLPGTFAQFVAVPADSLVLIPSGWSDEQAAGAALVYVTAYQALTQWGELKNAVVLVTGASGGVGVASVQLAAAMGCTVIGLSRSEEKQAKLKQLGATEVLDPQDTQWTRKLKKFLEPRRVDLAVDNIGGTLLPDVINTLGDLGKVSIVGRLAGPVPHFNTSTLIFRRLRLGGVQVGAYTTAEARNVWNNIVALLNRTQSKPLVDSVFPFDQLLPAFQRLQTGPMGKVLLKIA